MNIVVFIHEYFQRIHYLYGVNSLIYDQSLNWYIYIFFFGMVLTGRAGWRIILPWATTSILVDNIDMDRGTSNRVHWVPEKRRTWPREEALPGWTILWPIGPDQKEPRRDWETSIGWDQTCSPCHGCLPHIWNHSRCYRKRPYWFCSYL